MISPFLFLVEQRPAVVTGVLDFECAHTLRCTCHEYRMLSEGEVFYRRPSMLVALNPWDHAAGMVQEAGEVAELLDGLAYEPAMLEGRVLAGHIVWGR